ncbi:hypothetical protein M422DRAFT_61158 [Sphaerobolus stellatus SS14]|uniref:CxC6 like cysteine cluster associated with KDZ domain-containing protein n=1 Tax=Sphaerobolus stellatus (strain SS14) TaxID=990650 RepID=A0A0C9VG17_SPHS4|nr:hypothetical protein M422DRAFT_61158 [Sphaerobolus stellatus SS14]
MKSIQFTKITLFIEIVHALKVQIADSHTLVDGYPLECLHQRFRNLFKEIFGWEDNMMDVIWTLFRTVVWDYEGPVEDHQLGALLTRYRLKYDIDNGPIPVYITSFYCRGCYTRYYHNYYVHQNSTLQTYYGGIPDVIQSSRKIFVQASLCERFATQMVMAWTSATNCGRIYNAEFDNLCSTIALPFGWKFALKLDTDIVSDAFYLYSLLLDHSRQAQVLSPPHHAPNNTERLQNALEQRNERMVGPGQPEWNHACDVCTKISVSEDGSLVVMDGVTLGHPCCAIHDCVNPLPTNRHMCCLHDGVEIEQSVQQCDLKTDGTTKKPKARFGCRCTHNEEVCVTSCGMALGQVTFFGAEGLNGVQIFWKQLFPIQHSLPNVMWYDNNCGMQAMLRADNDEYFNDCALPVDVFHFKSKLKEQDVFCSMFCNPYILKDLVDEKEQGDFNSSAAEQTNAWLGGFHAILRDMHVERYNFFLDEMIMRHNQTLRRQLEEQGLSPYNIPRSELLE